jgi:glutathione-regulated potassium-efflux system protein KefB
METGHGAAGPLSLALVLLFAAVVSVPVARKLGLSAVVAYIGAGIAIGPFGLAVFTSPEAILVVAELGVVLLLFLIGLELEFSKLIAMRRAIFGLGAAQLVATAAVIGGLAYGCGLVSARGALVVGLALALSATAIALQVLGERGHLQQPYGQRAFAILLFQDMAVVPLIALMPLIAPFGDSQATSLVDTLWAVGRIAIVIAALVLAGRFLLNPFFRLLAATGAREAMTAAALLVVLGAALAMQAGGMSMALGAFLAGVLLAESNFRHELEADIEPFRGLLLALFFMGVGMSIDITVVKENFLLIVVAALAVTLLKVAIVAALFRSTCAKVSDALRAGSVLTAAGEFAFVLLPLGQSLGVLAPGETSLFSAIAAVTMLLGSPVATLTESLLRRHAKPEDREVDDFTEAKGKVLIIGFGRFGQLVTQCMLAQGTDVTLMDNDPEMIEVAARFGTKVYYGDGTRLDVLRAAGAASMRLIAVCIDNKDSANRIVDLVKADMPDMPLYVRSYDRAHTLELLAKDVDFEMRETFESALNFGRHALIRLGLDPATARAVESDVRERDLRRLKLQQVEGIYAGTDIMRRKPRPEPLNAPAGPGRALNPEAQDIIARRPDPDRLK